MSKKLEIKTTAYQRTLNLISLILLAGSFIALIFFWNDIPDKIPGHYNGAGEIDRWGGKGELWFIQLVLLVLYAGISVTERHPAIWNTGVTITEENRERVYRELKNLIVTMKFVLVFTFIYLNANSALARPLPGWFLPAELLALFGPTAFFLIKVYSKK